MKTIQKERYFRNVHVHFPPLSYREEREDAKETRRVLRSKVSKKFFFFFKKLRVSFAIFAVLQWWEMKVK
jgi:hypothetical protein